MNTNRPPAADSGFALTEALVALLLLAFALLGAGAALVDSLAGQRAAMLQVRAADLVADLAEALRSAPDAPGATEEVLAWQAAARRQLPQAEPLAMPRAPVPSGALLPAAFDIRLQWRDPQQPAPVQLVLPLGIGHRAGEP